jgi:co-chaperonin GroES (HSP10)
MAAEPTDEKHSIRMTADRLLVVPSQEAGDRKSRAGILIPATANVNRRQVWGEVVAAGPTVRATGCCSLPTVATRSTSAARST